MALQKASKRGMSVKKTKRSRDYTSMKAVGVKPIDETFKVAIAPLREGTDLRDNVQVAFASFKEACGLAPISNVKQCIRLLATRIANSGDHATLNYVMRGEVSSVYLQTFGEKVVGVRVILESPCLYVCLSICLVCVSGLCPEDVF